MRSPSHAMLGTLLVASVVPWQQSMLAAEPDGETCDPKEKLVIYQVFTRLFGNTQTEWVPWGSKAQNGVGKFVDFTDAALEGIRELGTTHIWYTGVLHHALVGDYERYGITSDDPDVVKGRAGSPYAVKDYYQVNPDLAVDPSQRLAEFDALVSRTHRHGMKVLIDIVPNHIARRYEGLNNPEGVVDFGEFDDVSVEYARENNFYYLPGQAFEVPDLPESIRPLGGEAHVLADGRFDENPAKWTGNGARQAKPSADDWYETVKINYGVRPDGSFDFPELPQSYAELGYEQHHAFWRDKQVPNSWEKFRDIVHFWLDRGVDGFRFDMAEMVPVEFWSYLNASIKMRKPDALLLAEVYQPELYRKYLQLGKMDYLYDKVDLYDTLKTILHGEADPMRIAEIQDAKADIEHHMLHFLENHDEQRIASPEFAGDAFRGLPLMVLSATLGTSPTLLYFAQELGEDGSEAAGFGLPSRTSIFDYIPVPAHQRWMNGGRFDGGQLFPREKELREWYRRLLNLVRSEAAFMGSCTTLHRLNASENPGYPASDVYAFERQKGRERIVVVVNFRDDLQQFELRLSDDEAMHGSSSPHMLLGKGKVQVKPVTATETGRHLMVELEPYGFLILKFE